MQSFESMQVLPRGHESLLSSEPGSDVCVIWVILIDSFCKVLLRDAVKCSGEGIVKSGGEKHKRLFIGVGHILLRYRRRVHAVNRALHRWTLVHACTSSKHAASAI